MWALRDACNDTLPEMTPQQVPNLSFVPLADAVRDDVDVVKVH
jgi:hypothetical protein